jgi:hypothetical protein
MSLDEDERLRSDAEAERFLRSVAWELTTYVRPSGTLRSTVHLVRWPRRMPRGDV